MDLSTHVRLFWTMILILTDCFEKSIPLVVGEVVENCVVVFHVTNVDHFDPSGTNSGQSPNWSWPPYLLYFYTVNHDCILICYTKQSYLIVINIINNIKDYIFTRILMIYSLSLSFEASSLYQAWQTYSNHNTQAWQALDIIHAGTYNVLHKAQR